jgi:hypothetical protein
VGKAYPGVSSDSSFRIRAKKLFLTYAQLPCVLPLDIKTIFLDSLTEQLGYGKYLQYHLITKEFHGDGGAHLHIFLEFNRTCEFRSRSSFTVDVSPYVSREWIQNDGKIFCQGQYKHAKGKNAILEYMLKDQVSLDDVLVNFKLPVFNGVFFERPEDHLLAILKDKGIGAATDALYDEYPSLAIRRGGSVLKNLSLAANYYDSKKLMEATTVIPFKNFINIPPEIKPWIESGFKETCLVLEGPSNTGKTELIKSVLKHNGLRYLFCRSVEGLREYVPSDHDAIVFDDLEIGSFSREKKIHLFDLSNPSQIRILYGCVSLPPRIHKIFSTNNYNEFIFGQTASGELSRRLTRVHIPKPLYESITLEKTTTEKITVSRAIMDENPHNYLRDASNDPES